MVLSAHYLEIYDEADSDFWCIHQVEISNGKPLTYNVLTETGKLIELFYAPFYPISHVKLHICRELGVTFEG